MNPVESSQHCSVHELNRLLEGQLSGEQVAAVEAHVEQCDTCNERLMVAAGGARFLVQTQSQLSSVSELPVLANSSALDIGDEHARQLDQLRKEIPFLPTDDPQMLGRLGGYEISGLIGRGGMGVVLKGWDAALDRYVAIKVLSPIYAHHAEMRLRFAREAKAAAAVVHENVIAIFGVDCVHDLPYLVMPYVRGESLQGRIDRTGPLPLEEVLEIALQVARGIQAAHDQGVVHRDIKPGNILIPRSVSRVMITDFGLARAIDDSNLTGSGLVAGTPAYMSPEQAKGEPIELPSDLFSLGSVMYAMCVGHSPFQANGSYATLRRIIDERHRPLTDVRPDLPAWFIAIIDRLLQKQPSQRYDSAAELARDLEQGLIYLRQPQNSRPPRPKQHHLQHRVGYRWVMFLMAVALLVTGVTVASHLSTSWYRGSMPVTSDRWDSELDQDFERLENELDLLNKELSE